MITETIHFDNAREAQDLTGSHFQLMKVIEKRLDVRLTSRDLWLKIEGEEAAVQRTTRFFSGLRHNRNRGIPTSKHGLIYLLKAFQAGEERIFEKLSSIRVDLDQSKKTIFPRTLGQQTYLKDIEKSSITFCSGPAGTGKTYLAMAMAVSALLEERVSRIILTRPALEAGENLGFLPGDLREKIDPYLRPLYDALYDMLPAEDVERYRKREIIEIAPLAYMRGRSLDHAFIILDEAQNTTSEQMFMFLTRLGFDSKCIVTGDTTQIDLPERQESGLLEAKRLLNGIEKIRFCELDEEDIVRHPLIQEVIRAYRERGE